MKMSERIKLEQEKDKLADREKERLAKEKKKNKLWRERIDSEYTYTPKSKKPLMSIEYEITSDAVRTAYFLLFGKTTRKSTDNIVKELRVRLPNHIFLFKKRPNRQ